MGWEDAPTIDEIMAKPESVDTKPTKAQVVFPKASEYSRSGGVNPIKYAGKGLYDILSLLPRAVEGGIEALPVKGDQMLGEMARVMAQPTLKPIAEEGMPGERGSREIVGNIVRDPVTWASMVQPEFGLSAKIPYSKIPFSKVPYGANKVSNFVSKTIVPKVVSGSKMLVKNLEGMLPASTIAALPSNDAMEAAKRFGISEAVAAGAAPIQGASNFFAKKALKKGLNVPIKTAKELSLRHDPNEGIDKLLNTIIDKNVNFRPTTEGMANKVQGLINKNNEKVNKLVTGSSLPRSSVINEDGSVAHLYPMIGTIPLVGESVEKDIAENVIPGMFGKEKQATTILNKILKSLEDLHQKRSYYGKGSNIIARPKEIVDLKNELTHGMSLFTKGKYNMAEDPTKNQVGEALYFKLNKLLEKTKHGPEIAKINKETSDLYDALNVLRDAAYNKGKESIIPSLPTMALGVGGGMAANYANANPTQTAIAAAIPILLGGGRAAPLLNYAPRVIRAGTAGYLENEIQPEKVGLLEAIKRKLEPLKLTPVPGTEKLNRPY